MRLHKLGEVENEHTLYNSIVLAIFVPKIIKVGEYLTKFSQKRFFETRCIGRIAWSSLFTLCTLILLCVCNVFLICYWFLPRDASAERGDATVSRLSVRQ